MLSNAQLDDLLHRLGIAGYEDKLSYEAAITIVELRARLDNLPPLSDG